MRIPDIEVVALLTVARADIAILRMVVADVELLSLACLHILLVHERILVWCLGISHGRLCPQSPKT